MVIFSNSQPYVVGACADDVRRLITGTDALVVVDEAYMDFGTSRLSRKHMTKPGFADMLKSSRPLR